MQHAHTHTHSFSLSHTHTVTEQGLIRTLTQTLIADPALFPADLLSLYCAKSVLLLWNKTFYAEREKESDTVRVIPIRGNQFGAHPPIFHSCPFYSSPLISPFIIFTLHSPTLPHPDSTYLQFPLLSLSPAQPCPLPLFSSHLLALRVFHRVKCAHESSCILWFKSYWLSVWHLFKFIRGHLTWCMTKMSSYAL